MTKKRVMAFVLILAAMSAGIFTPRQFRRMVTNEYASGVVPIIMGSSLLFLSYRLAPHIPQNKKLVKYMAIFSSITIGLGLLGLLLAMF